MKAVVVSDSHGRFGGIQEIIERELPFDLFLHAGDIQGGIGRIEEWTACPVFAARGNCDFYGDLPHEQLVRFGCHTIFLTHGHRYHIKLSVSEVSEAAKASGADIAVCGHTHKPSVEERNGVLVLNPGSVSEPRQENRRPTYLILTSSPDGKLSWEFRYLQE